MKQVVKDVCILPFILIVALFVVIERLTEMLGYPFWLIGVRIAGGDLTSVNDYRNAIRDLCI